MSIIVPKEVCEMLNIKEGSTRTRKTLMINMKKRLADKDVNTIEKMKVYSGDADEQSLIESVRTKISAIPLHEKEAIETAEASSSTEKKKKVKKPKKVQSDTDKPRKLTGFNSPIRISDEFCRFLNVPIGTEMSRVDAMKGVTAYIKEHKLQQEGDKRKINPDETLQNLLHVPEGIVLDWFNMNRFANVHFPKKSAAAKEFAAPAPA